MSKVNRKIIDQNYRKLFSNNLQQNFGLCETDAFLFYDILFTSNPKIRLTNKSRLFLNVIRSFVTNSEYFRGINISTWTWIAKSIIKIYLK